MDDNNVVIGGGRGRGRGRGGEAVLPKGLWDSLQHHDDNKDFKISSSSSLEKINDEFIQKNSDNNQYDDYSDDNDNDDDNNNDDSNRNNESKDGDEKPEWVKDTDWKCEKCENINWTWRQFCNKCQNPKPRALRDMIKKKDERRDGLGGGFNEKQERASASLSVEIDQEGYDDFGRRVKKADTQVLSKEEAALKRLNQSYGFLLTGQLPQEIKNKVIDKDNDKDKNRHSKDDRDDKNNRGKADNLYDKRGLGERDNKRNERRSRSRDRRDLRSRDRNDDGRNYRRSRSRDRNDNRKKERRSRSRDRRRSRSRSRDRRDRRSRSRDRRR